MISVHNANKIIQKIEKVGIRLHGGPAFQAIKESVAGPDEENESGEENIETLANHLAKKKKYGKNSMDFQNYDHQGYTDDKSGIV
jgi:hypothetical protein